MSRINSQSNARGSSFAGFRGFIAKLLGVSLLKQDKKDVAETASAKPTAAPEERQNQIRVENTKPIAAQMTTPLTLKRVEIIIKRMGYSAQLHEEDNKSCLLGVWNNYPFIIEEPDGHEGWLLVSGEWADPVAYDDREEIISSANDWNRDKFFPTVTVADTALGSIVRTIYLVDLTMGVTDAQLQLHIKTALSSCIQALKNISPLLPQL